MSHDMSNDASRGASPDKFDAHYRQQLSSLIDGELSADEARFMLRRLEHDESLSSCNERWQMLGDVLRGQACAPAPMDFAERVRASVAAEPAPAMQVKPERGVQRQERRGGWRRWGGGAALAASVAAVAMFMTREQLPAPAPLDAPTTIIASQAELPAAPVTEASAAGQALAVAAVPAAAVAAASRRQDVATARRASATRTQQAARSAAERSVEPQRAVASQAPLTPAVPAATARQFPFGEVGSLQAKPWPRSSLAPAAGGALNASFSTQAPQAAFYPFEPRLQESAESAEPARRHRD
ncbi:RseA family anti-sigma factor [Stenotrophomonas sp. JAI102]|uniref:RseA family anti-sigma factor n=1 Tax=Stenotrophomonas sp. JAI102 TaxID=2723077 RepID=UPI0015C99D62|nr:RseA family anti-sigma factor [Stenotrophomonas sp. JAI102]NYF34257.1 negative regulator of sigma E activity [Stenotrophomonas sp. JAI102]